MQNHFEILEKLEIYLLHPISLPISRFSSHANFELILKHSVYKEKEI